MPESDMNLTVRDGYVRRFVPNPETAKTAKDVTDLRKQGQLNEAFGLATELLAVEPDNVWTKRAMGWVRYERLKAVAKSKASDEFIQEWTALSALVATNPADETMLTNQAIWQVIIHLFAVAETSQANQVLNTVFESVQQWSSEKPSDLHSALLRAVLKAGKTWTGLADFVVWWGLGNLRPEDYLPGLTNNGKKMMSLAEQAYIAYAKQVLNSPEQMVVRALIVDLEVLHQQHPEYQYPPYYQAKLLVATGSKEEAMTKLLPFARRKQGEFWLWDLLAELYNDEPEKAIACLCRAVSCPLAQEKFLVNARNGLARKLNEGGKINEALTELTKSIEARKAEGWRVVDTLTSEMEKLQTKGAVVLSDNKALYRQYRPLTDELLYAGVPEQIGVVTYLNTDKKVAHFNVSRTVSSHFKFEDSMARVKLGDFVAVRLEERTGKEGKFWVPVCAKLTDEQPSSTLFKLFSGPVSIPDGKNFGFVDDVFLNPALLNGCENGAVFSGSALWVFDKLKSRDTWKIISVAKTDE